MAMDIGNADKASPDERQELPPLVLDFDNSVLPFSKREIRLPLEAWQKKIRFGCSHKSFREFERHLERLLPADYGCVFTGSGDYHHVSFLLLKAVIEKKCIPPDTLDVIVCDNHPDNMRYPFGLHCGSWVRAACGLPGVRHVHVVGITSPDITARHAWENYLGPFLRKKITYWSIGTRATWLTYINRGEYTKNFATVHSLLDTLAPVLRDADSIYLSVDKDVFNPDVVRTNWDQGLFDLEAMNSLIRFCSGRLVGADITGDVSLYAYTNLFKKLLSHIDGQSVNLAAQEIYAWQQEHKTINRLLLKNLHVACQDGHSICGAC